MTQTLNVVGIAGSLRAGSYNRALLRAAQVAAPADMAISAIDLVDVPLYNADVEAKGDPPGVVQFKAAILAADALLFVTPEYNHGVPGVLKNAIDWASRPPHHAVLDRKPVGVIGASTSITGSARGQSQLRQAFEFTNSYAMPSPEILVFRAQDKFDDAGNLIDPDTAKFLAAYLVALADWIALFKHS